MIDMIIKKVNDLNDNQHYSKKKKKKEILWFFMLNNFCSYDEINLFYNNGVIKYNNNAYNCNNLSKKYFYLYVWYNIKQSYICQNYIIYKLIGLDTNNFLGLHPTLYKSICNTYKSSMIIECFASPWNNSANFVNKKLKIERMKYCWMYDVDKIFGWIGSFFNKNFKFVNNNVYVINPPFIKNVINDTLEKIFIELKNNLLMKNTGLKIIMLFNEYWDLVINKLQKYKIIIDDLKKFNYDINILITWNWLSNNQNYEIKDYKWYNDLFWNYYNFSHNNIIKRFHFFNYVDKWILTIPNSNITFLTFGIHINDIVNIFNNYIF